MLIFKFNLITLFYVGTGTIAEANKNQLLITINMVKIYPVEADTKVISMWQPYTVMSIPHWYQNRFMHPHSTIDSLYLIDWSKLFQSRYALNNTEFMP